MPDATTATSPWQRLVQNAPARALYAAPVVVGIVLWTALGRSDADIGTPLDLALLAIGFICAERVQLFIDVRRQTIALSTANLALTVGLLAVGPVGLLIARLVAKAVVLATRRPSIGKSLFNFGLGAVVVGVAAALARAVGISGGIDAPRTWGAVFAGILGAELSGILFILLAVFVTERTITARRLVMLSVPPLSVGLVNTTLALVGLLVVSVNPWASCLLLVVIVVFLYAYRAYGRFLAQHERLGRVYEFSKIVESSRNESLPVGELLNHFRETLNAERISIYVDVPVPESGGIARPVRTAAGRTVSAVSVRSDGSVAPWWQESLAADPLRAEISMNTNR